MPDKSMHQPAPLPASRLAIPAQSSPRLRTYFQIAASAMMKLDKKRPRASS